MRRPRRIHSIQHLTALSKPFTLPAYRLQLHLNYPTDITDSMTATTDSARTRPPLVRKNFILVLVATLSALFILFYLASNRSIHRSLRRLLPSVREYDAASEGALGQALFESFTGRLPGRPGDPGYDLAMLAVTSMSSPADKQRLIQAYRQDPEKFKRYAAMGNTAANGELIGGWLLSHHVVNPPPDSTSLEIPKHLKFDAWARPLCILPLANSSLAVISGGPSHIPCNALPLTAAQLEDASREIFEGPNGIVVTITRPKPPGASRPTTPAHN